MLVELAPDTRVRNDHVTTSEHGYLRSMLIFGTRDGGAFELTFLRVDEIDAARARFAELSGAAASGD